MSDNILINYTKWLFKWLMIIAVGLIGLIILAVVGYYTYRWFSYDRHVASLEVVVFSIDDKSSSPKGIDIDGGCSPQFPIFIGILNKSSRTVERITFSVKATLSGRSTNLLKYSDSLVSQDFITEPKTGMGTCYSFDVDKLSADPLNLLNPIYAATISTVTFKK